MKKNNVFFTKYFVLLIGCSLVLSQLKAQNQSYTIQTDTIRWLSLEQAEKLHKAQPKTILIDMYTDWCGWCKKLDATTYSNPAIARYINTYFYPVKFNAETHDTIYYRDTMYVNSGIGQRPAHALAIKLLNGRMSYPTTVYIDENFRANAVPGYMDVPQIEPILVYFAERVYNTSNYDDFQKAFKQTFSPETADTFQIGQIKWMSFDEVNKAMEKFPKKIFFYIYQDMTPSSKIMSNTTYKNKVIADIINESYYPVKLEVTSKDTVNFLGHVFGNDNDGVGSPHNLAATLLQPVISVPATILFDEKGIILYNLKGFAPASSLELYLEYIRTDEYKKGNWVEFSNSFPRKIKSN